MAGTYACEVSTEAPDFLTTYAEANMSVAVPPKSAPVVDGLRPYYEVGDILRAECTSAPSHPPAVLTFFLNEKEVTINSSFNALPVYSERFYNRHLRIFLVKIIQEQKIKRKK